MTSIASSTVAASTISVRPKSEGASAAPPLESLSIQYSRHKFSLPRLTIATLNLRIHASKLSLNIARITEKEASIRKSRERNVPKRPGALGRYRQNGLECRASNFHRQPLCRRSLRNLSFELLRQSANQGSSETARGFQFFLAAAANPVVGYS